MLDFSAKVSFPLAVPSPGCCLLRLGRALRCRLFGALRRCLGLLDRESPLRSAETVAASVISSVALRPWALEPPAAAFGFLEAGAGAAGSLGHGQRQVSKRGGEGGVRGIQMKIISEKLVFIGESLSAIGASGSLHRWKVAKVPVPSVSSEQIIFFFSFPVRDTAFLLLLGRYR